MKVRSNRPGLPRLTLACGLDPGRLTALFADASVIDHLLALDAHVALMLSDLSPERAAVVQQLNASGIPVVAVPLVPPEDEYYFTADNMPRARQQYGRRTAWTAQYGLAWEGVGLDIEWDAAVHLQITDNP